MADAFAIASQRGAVNDVGRAVTWLDSTLRLPDAETLRSVLFDEPTPGTPLVLPFFSGERSTGWVGESRAVIHRINAATGPLDLYRGTMEGVAWTYARMLAQMLDVIGRPAEILGTGRVSNELPGLLQLVADATGVPVTPITIKRSTLRGTALHALEVHHQDAALLDLDLQVFYSNFSPPHKFRQGTADRTDKDLFTFIPAYAAGKRRDQFADEARVSKDWIF